MKKTTTFFVALLGFAGSLFAQTGAVKGLVTDNEGALPMVRVYVGDSASSVEAYSDFDGNFKLSRIPVGKQQIHFAFLGYQELVKEVEVVDGQVVSLGNVTMSIAVQELGEVTVDAGHMVKGEMKAVNMKKNSDKIVDVIAADGIGKLPDRNAGEAVQRAPGVSIERDQGEGRFVAVRGLPAEWSSATINGNRIPTAEEETVTRATAFDFFPSDMIQFVEVNKAITPDMEGDAIGGSVNFVTRTAPEQKTLNITGGLGASQKAGEPIWSGSVLLGNRSKNGKFGYLVNGTYWNRNYATDNYEPRRGGDGIGIRRLELRDYTGNRQTYGLNGAAEYKPNDKNKIYVRGMYGSLRDDELHYKHRLRFDKDRVEVQNIHNVLVTEMKGGEIGGDHDLSTNTKLEWKLAHYDNQFFYGNVPNEEDKSYYVVRFDQSNVGYENLEDRGAGNLAYNEIDGGTDPWNQISTHLPSDFQVDPSQATLAWVELYKVSIRERDNIVANLDLTTEASNRLTLKFGAKYRNKVRNASFADEFYAWDETKAGKSAPTLADFNTTAQPGGDAFLAESNGGAYSNMFGAVMTKEDLDNFWNENKQYMTLDSSESALVENGGALGRTFDVMENHISGYGMATYKLSDKVSMIGGVRMTQTMVEVDGYEYNEDEGKTSAVTNTNSYLSVLPMAHLKYSPTNDVNVRFAATHSFARPSFGSISPGSSYSEHDNNLRGGNPDLKPTYSWNFDAMVEKYFGNVGSVSGGFFHKVITDPIFQTTTYGTYNGVDGVKINRPENGETATLTGFETSFGRKLDFLPGVLSGFAVNANMTFMHSEMSIPEREDKVTIPRQATYLYNIALSYERNKISVRLALNHKGAYVMEHGSAPTEDIYFAPYTTMDASATYKLSDRVLFFAEMNNLLNTRLMYYQGHEERPLQVEYYGMRGMAGVRVNLF